MKLGLWALDRARQGGDHDDDRAHYHHGDDADRVDEPRPGPESQRTLPPVAINQALPLWNPPSGLHARTYRGAIHIVIDETGAVSSAVIVRSINKMYDVELLEAARRWKFVPATLNEKPVRFLKIIDVALGPPQ